MESSDYLITGPKKSDWTVVLAHGAGATMDSPSMNTIASGLADRGLKTVRFEFPYMRERRETGKRRPPNPPKVLEQSWLNAIEDLGGGARLVIGGKSMGGRIASMVADTAEVGALICLGYPFHPPGRPEKQRTAHLKDLRTRTLILQGERDIFGKQEEIDEYELSNSISIVYIEDGDHSFKPRKASGRSIEQNMEKVFDEIDRFLSSI